MKKIGFAGLGLLVALASAACDDGDTTGGGTGGTETGTGQTGGTGGTGTGTGQTGGTGGTATGATGGGGSGPVCGDGNEEGTEECDDGNARSHDGCSSGCTDEVPTWTQLTPTTNVPTRHRFGMAYERMGQRTILFGGFPPGLTIVPSDQTWSYDRGDNTWVQLAPSTPPSGRWSHAMAYFQSMTGQVLLFGGATSSSATTPTTSNETFLFTGGTNQWAAAPNPGTPPTARYGAAAVWDETNSRVVLFGGRNSAGTMDYDFTYEYTGTWANTNAGGTHPSVRYEAAMAFDSARGRIVLFGGNHADTNLDDTFELDVSNDTWSEVTTVTSPPARSQATMAYDPIREVMVLYGGDSNTLTDTWEYDGSNWSVITASPSPTPGRCRMVYDVRYRRIIAVGSGETWEYRATSAWPDEVCDTAGDEDGDELEDCADPDCDGLPCSGGTCSSGTCS